MIQADSGTESAPDAKRAISIWLLGTATAGLVLLAATLQFFYFSSRILPRSTIGGVEVGGMKPAQAKENVAAAAERFLGEEIVFAYGSERWTVTPGSLGAAFDEDRAVAEAYARGKEDSPMGRLLETVRAPFTGRAVELRSLPLSAAAEQAVRLAGASSVESETVETGLAFAPDKVETVPGKAGEKISFQALSTSLQEAFASGNREIPLETLRFEPEITSEQAEPARLRAEAALAGRWQVRAGDGALLIEPAELASWLRTSVERDASGRAAGLALSVDRAPITKRVAAWSESTSEFPVDAQLKMENGVLRVAREGRAGAVINAEKTVDRVAAALLADNVRARSVEAVAEVVQPEIRSETLGSLGIEEMIGSASTDFSGSPANRSYNIGLGARSLNGILVKDGETFSTMRNLGTIDESSGYRAELVIKGNRTIPEAGGGLCQVSTTLFRAVLDAGLPVTDRRNHAYRVGYYERNVGPGLDATIYDPNSDFKWKNDTGNPVFIQSYVAGTEISFEIYGTSDGRSSSVGQPQILETYPAGDPIYQNSDSLPAGQTKQIETAHDGAKVSVAYAVTRNGEEINRQTFSSTYKAWPAQYLVGTR